jgi:hypothetical protein
MGLCCSHGSDLSFSSRRAEGRKRLIPFISKSLSEPTYHELDTPRFLSRRSTIRHEADDLSDLLWEGFETPKFGEVDGWDLSTETQGEEQQTRKESCAEEPDDEAACGF